MISTTGFYDLYDLAGYSPRILGMIMVNHGKSTTIKSPRQRKITYGSMGRSTRSMLILAIPQEIKSPTPIGGRKRPMPTAAVMTME